MGTEGNRVRPTHFAFAVHPSFVCFDAVVPGGTSFLFLPKLPSYEGKCQV